MVQVANFLDEAVKITIQIQSKTGKKLEDFIPALNNYPEIHSLKERVENFSKKFPMPGQ